MNWSSLDRAVLAHKAHRARPKGKQQHRAGDNGGGLRDRGDIDKRFLSHGAILDDRIRSEQVACVSGGKTYLREPGCGLRPRSEVPEGNLESASTETVSADSGSSISIVERLPNRQLKSSL